MCVYVFSSNLFDVNTKYIIYYIKAKQRNTTETKRKAAKKTLYRIRFRSYNLPWDFIIFIFSR